MKKTFNGILDRMVHLLKELGVEYAAINRDQKIYQTQNKAYEQGLRTERNGQLLEIIVQATRIVKTSNSGKHSRELPRFHHLSFDWFIAFNVILSKNEHDLSLSLTKETTGNKLTKLLWKRDLEVFNDEFDAAFWIKSNHAYAHATLLDAAMQTQLLNHIKLFGALEIQKNRVHYQESLIKKKKLEAGAIKEHYLSMLNLCLTLAQKVELWEPPVDP